MITKKYIYYTLMATLSFGVAGCDKTAVNETANTDDSVYNRLDLQADAVKRVDNDDIEAQLFIEKTASNPQRLAQQINPIIEAALDKSKAYPSVTLATANQSSHPNYNYKNNTITSWTMRSDLRLISNDFTASSELIADLQAEGLQVADIQFKVSDAQRQNVENALITQVTDNFKQRAEVAKTAWGATDYRLVNLSINSNTNVPPQPYYGNASYASLEASDASQAAPIAGGDQRIEMVAQGAIELIF